MFCDFIVVDYVTGYLMKYLYRLTNFIAGHRIFNVNLTHPPGDLNNKGTASNF